jgi:hypothetical protein
MVLKPIILCMIHCITENIQVTECYMLDSPVLNKTAHYIWQIFKLDQNQYK